jgi:putative nucleotidyltransferase with HDIG domain
MASTKINFKNIPVQAGIISKIISLDVESNNCFQELDELIGSDQGVASLLLRVVNSPFYSRGNKVATIPYAISLLGYSVVRSLALMAFSRSLFSQTRNSLFRLHIWQHSLLTAIASQSICEKLGKTNLKDDAFVAGLMHDTGKVLMFTHDPDLYAKVFALSFESNCSSLQAERQYFGFDHCDTGLEAVTEWKLPERFNEYMGKALQMQAVDHNADAVLLSLSAANYLVKSAGIGASLVDDYETRYDALRSLGLNDAICEALLQDEYFEDLKESDTYKLCASI